MWFGRLKAGVWGAFGLLGLAQPAHPFYVQEGSIEHRFVQSPAGSAHVLLAPDRLQLNFPQGNSGILIRFRGAPRLEWVGGGFDLGGGLEVNLRAEASTVPIESILIGSIREIRGAAPAWAPGDETELERLGLLPRLRIGVSSDTLRVIRPTLETGLQYHLTVRAPGGKAESLRQGWELRPGAQKLLRIHARVPSYEHLTPYQDSELFRREFLEKLRRDPDPRVEQALRNLMFLFHKEKVLAGSWSYLTYFGRDTLIAALVLRQVLTAKAYESALQSVLDRLGPSGEVAHEEDIGALAERHTLREFLDLRRQGRSRQAALALRRPHRPRFDYRMVDDDFLLPIAMAHASPGFLRANRERVILNLRYVLDRARPYGRRPEPENLIPLKPGEKVGDWRDSEEGLGGGRYPLSVNGYLVPAALRSLPKVIEKLRSGGPDKAYKELGTAPEELKLWAVRWTRAKNSFRVTQSPESVRDHLARYLAAFGAEERRYFLDRSVEGVSLREVLDGHTPPSLRKGLSFYAVSLDERLQPVRVLNSDPAFGLFLGDPEVPEPLKLPFPLGLDTEVGWVVANPLFSPAHWKVLDRRAYHGTVVWGFPLFLYALSEEGLGRPGRWRGWFARAGGHLHWELWGFEASGGRLVPGRSLHPSNPVQLWSALLPALPER